MHVHLLLLFAAGALCAALPQQETSVIRGSLPPGGCLLPDTPSNGEYTSPLCKPGDLKPGCDNVPGTPVPAGWTIKYRCFRGYDISSENSTFSVCDNGVWDNPIECVKMCPRLRSYTLDIVCIYKDREVDCNHPMKLNTTAVFQCKLNYSVRKPLEYSSIKCGSQGLWDHDLPECIADCGVPNKNTEPLIVGGPSTTTRDFPWLVAIYRQNESLLWSYVCSGTLISPTSLLTAAHCVTTPEAELINLSDLKVGLGKYFRGYYKQESNSIIAQVRKIIIPNRYNGAASSFARDIALLVLSVSVPMSNHIMPACVDWAKTSVFKPNNTLSEGYLPGWGSSEAGLESDVVRATKLKYINQTECIKKVRRPFQRFVLVDKFCATVADNVTGSQLDYGNSGGGMTVVEDGVHYVVGVFSTRLSTDQPFSLFTDLNEHLQWLEIEKSALEMIHRSELNKEEDE